MVVEILEVLHPQPGEIAADCTLGYGGHARELLAKLQPGGRLIGLDVDSGPLTLLVPGVAGFLVLQNLFAMLKKPANSRWNGRAISAARSMSTVPARRSPKR